MGQSAFRKIQTGREATAGTSVAATAKQMGLLTMEEAMVLHRPDEERGSLADAFRTVITGEGVDLSFEGDATFEQSVYWLENAVKTVAATGPGGDGDYTYTYEPALTSANTPKTFTIEYGDDIQEQEVEYCVTSELEISGAMDEPWKVKATIFGRNLVESSFTAALSDPVVESILTNKTKLYLDNTGGSHGGTEKAATLIDFSLKISTGYGPGKHGGAALYFDTLRQKKIKITLDMTLEYNAGAETERALYVAGTIRLARLIGTGTLIGGTTYKTATMDVAGVYTKWSTLEDNDGADVVSVTLESQYDATWAKLLSIIIVNATASIA